MDGTMTDTIAWQLTCILALGMIFLMVVFPIYMSVRIAKHGGSSPKPAGSASVPYLVRKQNDWRNLNTSGLGYITDPKHDDSRTIMTEDEWADQLYYDGLEG